MSGGTFDYNQFRIRDIWESIQRELDKQRAEKSEEDLKYSWNKEDTTYYTYPKEIQEELKKAVKYLKLAEIYAHRIDYLLAGDDGEESFLKRLKEDLEKENIIE